MWKRRIFLCICIFEKRFSTISRDIAWGTGRALRKLSVEEWLIWFEDSTYWKCLKSSYSKWLLWWRFPNLSLTTSGFRFKLFQLLLPHASQISNHGPIPFNLFISNSFSFHNRAKLLNSVDNNKLWKAILKIKAKYCFRKNKKWML